jgi:SAM-dependent methyltransferase
MDHVNPFEGLTPELIYQRLIDTAPDKPIPTWPDEKTQSGYAGTHGPGLVRRTQAFIAMLEADGAFVPGWKGLDYGCGWGRFASMLLTKGSADQLDLVDAWDSTLRLLSRYNQANKRWQVSEFIQNGEIPESTYDFILSFSVFTHLAQGAFEHNIDALRRSLKPNGKLYFTVRHEDLIEHLHPGRRAEIEEVLQRDGFWFDPNYSEVFGTTIVTQDFLSQRWPVRSLGQPHNLQHVYALSGS